MIDFKVGDMVWDKVKERSGKVVMVAHETTRDSDRVAGYDTAHRIAWEGLDHPDWFEHKDYDLVHAPASPDEQDIENAGGSDTPLTDVADEFPDLEGDPIDTDSFVYIAGPMRGYAEFNFPAFDTARDYLLAAGYFTWSPADHDRGVGFDVSGLTGNEDLSALGFDLRAALAKDMEIIAKEASAVAVLPGWEKSSGARAEVALAHALGLPVAYFTEFGSNGVIRGKIETDLKPSTNAVKHKLIGITGQKRTGKDTLGAEFVGLGYKRVGLADPIKDFAEILNPYLVAYGGSLSHALEAYGWEEAKDVVPESRLLLQQLGTDAGRTILGDNVWVDAAMKRVKETDGPVVITDVRFDNEAQAILDAGGIVIRVTRPGTGDSGDTHASEAGINRSLVTHDYVNDGSLADIYEWVYRLVKA